MFVVVFYRKVISTKLISIIIYTTIYQSTFQITALGDHLAQNFDCNKFLKLNKYTVRYSGRFRYVQNLHSGMCRISIPVCAESPLCYIICIYLVL